MACTMLIYPAAFLAMCGLALSSVEVKPFMVATLPGSDVQFICTVPDNETRSAYLEWTVSNSSKDSLPTVIPSSGRIQAQNGTLTISNSTLEDANTYTCRDIFSNETETGTLKVYIMPDYLTEGLVIAGICAGLILVLVVGSIISMVRQRQQRKQRLLETDTSPTKKRHKFKKLNNY
jgi:hypothetical protein